MEDTPVLREKRKKTQHPLTKDVTLKKDNKPRKIRKSKKSGKNGNNEQSEDDEKLQGDFSPLSIHTLRKYRKQYNLPIPSNAHKADLVKEVNKHFPKMSLEDEKTIVTYFIHFAKQENDMDEDD